MIAEGQGTRLQQLNEMDHAVAQQKLATSLTPENPARWIALAELYDAQGEIADSSQARQRAQSIQDAGKNAAKLQVPRVATNHLFINCLQACRRPASHDWRFWLAIQSSPAKISI